MRAILCKEFGDPSVLFLGEAEEPDTAPGMVKIQIHSAGLNFPDTLLVAGKYQAQPPFPFSPGMECAGTVAELGEGVTHLGIGDRVMAHLGHGGFAEYVLAEGPHDRHQCDRLGRRVALENLMGHACGGAPDASRLEDHAAGLPGRRQA